MEVIFEGNDFTPFELGKNSLVETAINEIGPLLVEETDLPTSISPVVHNQSDFARQPVQFQVNTVQWSKEESAQNIEAQEDTGANASATNNLEIIHDYKPFNAPEPVGVFYEGDKDATLLTTEGTGYILIISDQGNVMRWKVVYTPKSNGTVLSPDNYHRANKEKLFGFFHCGNLLDIGTIGFTDGAGKIVESISLRRNNNGQ